MMAMLTLAHMSKRFGSQTILKDISMTVNEGEFVAIVGPSGCGKSTLLRLIAGLDRPTQGEIFIEDKMVNLVEPYERNIGMVFQNYALYPHLTIFENMAFGLMAHGVSKKKISKQVDEIAVLLELQSLLKKRPGALSGGQRQRVALGRAMVRQPRIFLMDEPLSNLDALLRDRMRVELRRIHERIGITTIYVTHDQTEAMTMADRIVVMNNGTMLQMGSPEEIYHTPQTTFVASFFGSPPMNIWRLQVTLSDVVQASSLQNSENRIELPLEMKHLWQGALDQENCLQCGVRPESWRLGGEKKNSHVMTVVAQIERIESLGARKIIYAHWGEMILVAAFPNVPSFARNSEVTLSVPWKDVHWFHGSSGEAIRTEEKIMIRAGGGIS